MIALCIFKLFRRPSAFVYGLALLPFSPYSTLHGSDITIIILSTSEQSTGYILLNDQNQKRCKSKRYKNAYKNKDEKFTETAKGCCHKGDSNPCGFLHANTLFEQ